MNVTYARWLYRFQSTLWPLISLVARILTKAFTPRFVWEGFPILITRCPSCGCKDTICRLACEHETTIDPNTFVSLEKVATPLVTSNQITTPTVKAIMSHYDNCAKCGFRYSTKSEIVVLPVGGVPSPKPPPQMHGVRR